MINTLFRTQFESNTAAFIVFLALHALMGFLLLTIHVENGYRPLGSDAYFFIVMWLLVFCAIAVTMALLRHNREKRCRLYAQLPVTPRQVRLAYWCLAALFILVSTGMLILIMLLADDLLLQDVAVFAVLHFVHAGVLLAVLSIVTSNNLTLIPEEIRRRTIMYFFMAALLTFLTLFLLGLLVAAYIQLLADGNANWGLLTVLMLLGCAGLVATDVHLFQRKDDYLG